MKKNSSRIFKLKGQLKRAERNKKMQQDTPEAAEIRNRGYEKMMALIDRFKGVL